MDTAIMGAPRASVEFGYGDATKSETGCRISGPDTLDGSDVRMTHVVSDSGSAHASIPVDPL